ncbi:hypothetical protein KCP75_02740 [Salmonella enterica subsp. enterica]|nr:hypothetical protein KCP75_02740 [Salmonella enterica subsp. enterica]
MVFNSIPPSSVRSERDPERRCAQARKWKINSGPESNYRVCTRSRETRGSVGLRSKIFIKRVQRVCPAHRANSHAPEAVAEGRRVRASP